MGHTAHLRWPQQKPLAGSLKNIWMDSHRWSPVCGQQICLEMEEEQTGIKEVTFHNHHGIHAVLF